MSWKAEVARSRGNELFRSGKFEEALEAYKVVLENAPQDHIAYSNRAATYLRLGRWQEAEKDCNDGLRYEPKHVKSYARRAQARLRLGNAGSALEDIAEAVALDVRQVPLLAELKAEAEELLEENSAVASGDSAARDEVDTTAMAAAGAGATAASASVPDYAPNRDASNEARADHVGAEGAAGPGTSHLTVLSSVNGVGVEQVVGSDDAGDLGSAADASCGKQEGSEQLAVPSPVLQATGLPAANGPQEVGTKAAAQPVAPGSKPGVVSAAAPAAGKQAACSPWQGPGRNPALQTKLVKVMMRRGTWHGVHDALQPLEAVSDDEEIQPLPVSRLAQAQALGVGESNKSSPGSIQILSEAIQLAPEVPKWYLSRGLARMCVQHSHSNMGKAVADFTVVAELSGSGPNEEAYMALMRRGQLLETFGDFEGALQDFSAAADRTTSQRDKQAAEQGRDKMASILGEAKGSPAKPAAQAAHYARSSVFEEVSDPPEGVIKMQAAAGKVERLLAYGRDIAAAAPALAARLQAEEEAAAERVRAENAQRAEHNVHHSERRKAALLRQELLKGGDWEEVVVDRTIVPVVEVYGSGSSSDDDWVEPSAALDAEDEAAGTAAAAAAAQSAEVEHALSPQDVFLRNRQSTVVTDDESDSDAKQARCAPSPKGSKVQAAPGLAVKVAGPSKIAKLAATSAEAEHRLRSKQYSQAERLYIAYLEHGPSDQAARVALAQCHNGLGNQEGALEALAAAQAVKHPSPAAPRVMLHCTKAEALQKLRRLPEAKAEYELAEQHAETPTELQRVQQALVPVLAQMDSQGLLEKGTSGAVPAMGPSPPSATRGPSPSTKISSLITDMAATGETPIEAAAGEVGLGPQPPHPLAAHTASSAHVNGGSSRVSPEVPPGAPSEAEEAETRQTVSALWRAKGNTLFGRGEYETAVERYEIASKLASDCKLAWANKAAACLKLERWADAEEAASRLDHRYDKARHRRAMAYWKQGNRAGAYIDFAILVDADPSDVKTSGNMKKVQAEMYRRGEDIPDVGLIQGPKS